MGNLIMNRIGTRPIGALKVDMTTHASDIITNYDPKLTRFTVITGFKASGVA